MTIVGPLLNPRRDGKIDFIADAALSCDDTGTITYVGPRTGPLANARPARGVIAPPFLDAHIHIPQHPIRGRFMEGVAPGSANGRLIAGLNRNVFPTEGKCSDDEYTRVTVRQFLHDTLSNGVVGGAAYMTVHPRATRIALEELPETWSVGLLLMDMNCPPYLRTDVRTLEQEVRSLAQDFGARLIVTDRFAVAVSTPLRKRAARLAKELGLRMQTHLNEQIGEKRFIEQTLYPDYQSYTDVYRRDGLLDCDPILAHCVRMSETEFALLKSHRCAIAHCPTSNTLLGSGVMPLDHILDTGIPFAICTDVGASPTTSVLAEMAQFVKVHASTSKRATPGEALYRSTLAAAEILGLGDKLGRLEIGRPMSFIETDAGGRSGTADEVIQSGLLNISEQQIEQYRNGESARAIAELREFGLDDGPALSLLEGDTRETAAALERKVLAVTLAGREVWARSSESG